MLTAGFNQTIGTNQGTMIMEESSSGIFRVDIMGSRANKERCVHPSSHAKNKNKINNSDFHNKNRIFTHPIWKRETDWHRAQRVPTENGRLKGHCGDIVRGSSPDAMSYLMRRVQYLAACIMDMVPVYIDSAP